MIATDRLFYNLSDPPGGSFPPQEYLIGRGYQVQSVVYVRQTEMHIRYKVYNPNEVPLNIHFTFEDPKFERTYGPMLNLSGYEDETLYCLPFSTVEFNVTVSGLPSYVTLGYLRAKINIDSEAGGLNSLEHTRQIYVYITDSTPTGHMSTPWVEVLADACKWADGSSGPQYCATAITHGIYNSWTIDYNGGSFPQYWMDYTKRSSPFLLTLFFRDRDQGFARGDCRDVSGYVSIASSSIGHSLALEQELTDYGDSRGGFITNLVKPISSGGGYSYQPYAFIFHQVCLGDDGAYDACLASSTLLPAQPTMRHLQDGQLVHIGRHHQVFYYPRTTA